MTSDRSFDEGERSLLIKALAIHIIALNAAADALSQHRGIDGEVILGALLSHGLARMKVSSPQALRDGCNQMLHLLQALSPDEPS